MRPAATTTRKSLPGPNGNETALSGAALLEAVPELADLMEATKPGIGHTAFLPALGLYVAAVRLDEETSVVVTVRTPEEARAMLREVAVLSEVPS